jgi:hypothetical protein
MNKSLYTSLPLAKKLVEAGIVFEESDKAWGKEGYLYSDGHEEHWPWELKDKEFALHSKQLAELSPHRKTLYYEIIPAPSLGEALERLPSPLKLARVLGQGKKDYFLKMYFFHSSSKAAFKYRLCYARSAHSPCIDYDVTANTAINAAILMLLKLEEEK